VPVKVDVAAREDAAQNSGVQGRRPLAKVEAGEPGQARTRNVHLDGAVALDLSRQHEDVHEREEPCAGLHLQRLGCSPAYRESRRSWRPGKRRR
jgi:hypothetical protein